jgi:hypothetical protein
MHCHRFALGSKAAEFRNGPRATQEAADRDAAIRCLIVAPKQIELPQSNGTDVAPRSRSVRADYQTQEARTSYTPQASVVAFLEIDVQRQTNRR